MIPDAPDLVQRIKTILAKLQKVCPIFNPFRNAHKIISRFLAVSGNPLRSIPETKWQIISYPFLIPERSGT